MGALRYAAEVYRIGRFEVQAFSRSGVQAVLNEYDLVCCDLDERHFLREVLPDQTVDIFVCSAFPAVVWLGKETFATEFCGDLFVAGELLAVIKRDGFDDLVFEQTQYLDGNLVGKQYVGDGSIDPDNRRYESEFRPPQAVGRYPRDCGFCHVNPCCHAVCDVSSVLAADVCIMCRRLACRPRHADRSSRD